MAVKKDPLFTFNNLLERGINNVPLDNTIMIIDSDGLGNARQVVKISNNGMMFTSSIADFLADDTLYNEIQVTIDIDGGLF